MKSTIASRQLRALSALAEHRNYTRAALDLQVTQSAVTHAIQTLERDLGVPVVRLHRNRMTLTRVGKKVLHHANRILREMHEIRAHTDRVLQRERRARRRRLLPTRKAA